MPALVLTTVGTSALTNRYVDNIAEGDLRRWAREERYFTRNPQFERKLAAVVARNWSIVKARGSRVPAEIASLARILNYYQIRKDDGSHFVFVCSDTEQGKASGWVNVHAFREIFKVCSCAPDTYGKCVHIDWDYVKDLHHEKASLFLSAATGLKELMRREVEKFQGAAAEQPKVQVFNMTGSYKGLVPFATEFCNQKQFEMVYLYEDSERLVFKMPEDDTPDFETE